MGEDTCELLCLDLPRAEALRRSRLPMSELELVAGAANALADPTRLVVARAPWVCERSDQLVSHHARVLGAAGLVTSRRVGKMVLYSLIACGERLLDTIAAADAEFVR